MQKKTLILVDQAGNMKIDQQGFTGTQCEEATKKLMAGIKSESSTEEKKPEFFNRTATQSQQKQGW